MVFEYYGDIYCVTTWSKFDIIFGGVSVDTLLDVAQLLPMVKYVFVILVMGYIINFLLEHVIGG